MKTCATCKHRERGLSALLSPAHLLTCNRPSNRQIDPVVGKPKTIFCNIQRQHDYGLTYMCGVEGKYWEQK